MHTNEEHCEMVLLYGQSNRSKTEVARLYAIKFPCRTYSSFCTIARAVQHLYKAGSCHRRIPLSHVTPSSLRIPAEDVLGYALTHPESSVRDISKACSYSKLTVWNILHTCDGAGKEATSELMKEMEFSEWTLDAEVNDPRLRKSEQREQWPSRDPPPVVYERDA
ncbi:DUF4817 domain-containing protein [Trichonephila clavipes]|nr:DUF4817 domain-containing protein [Trichonephila clavipes]